MVLIEGAYFGCVPIAFESFKSVNDIITNNKNGFIIKPYNLGDYTRKLCSLLNDKDLVEEMRKNAIESVGEFDLQIIAVKWIKIFNEVTK